MATPSRFPEIRSLSERQCRTVLRRHRVGRIGFTYQDRVNIHPVHYACDGDWLYVRTSDGEMLTVVAHHPWVAFEVDDVRGPFDWTCVLVHGSVYRVDADAPHPDAAAEARGEELLGRVIPGAYTESDPTPYRHVMLRIAIKGISGRRASRSWRNPSGARDVMAY